MTFAGLLITLSSCKKDWLDVTSSTEIRATEQFSSEAGFRDALIGVYIGMTDPAMFGRDMTYNLVDLLSQQYNPLTTLALYFQVQQYNYTGNRSQRQINAIWNKSYGVIANINNALTFIDERREILNPISYSIIKGELLGLRAYVYFDLLRLYGYGNLANRTDVATKLAIPYVTTFSKDLTAQKSYVETFALLNKDINESLILLKEDPIFPNPGRPANYFAEVNRLGFYNNREKRMNYYAAKALQARVLLWQGGTANVTAAKLVAEEVIASSPARLVNGTAAGDPVLYREHIFNLDINGFINIVNPLLIAQDGTQYDALFLSTSTAQSVYETSNPNIGPADFRFNTLLESQARGLVSIKLRQNLTTNYVGRNAMPLLKLPEMYYIAAEAYITENLPKAIEYLNLVRTSRGIIQLIPANATATVVSQELFKEYRKEFINEGQLFYYFKRTGLLQIPGLAVTTIANDRIYVLPYPDSEIEFGRVQ
jgi:hypothetical protein